MCTQVSHLCDIYTHTHPSVILSIHTYTCVVTHTHTHTHTSTQIYMHTHTHTQAHPHTHSWRGSVVLQVNCVRWECILRMDWAIKCVIVWTVCVSLAKRRPALLPIGRQRAASLTRGVLPVLNCSHFPQWNHSDGNSFRKPNYSQEQNMGSFFFLTVCLMYWYKGVRKQFNRFLSDASSGGNK